MRSSSCVHCAANFMHTTGRTPGTSQAAGYGVGRSTGRTRGTTEHAGYGVSQSGHHPRPSKRRAVEFDNSIQLPTSWDNAQKLVNVDREVLDICSRRIAQQRTYDKKPLGTGVCYRCGHMLWTTVDGGHTFLVNKPSGMSVDDAPASAYLRAVPKN